MELLTRERLAAMPPTLTGGAWGTELMARGADPAGCLAEWNLTEPDQVVDIAREYTALGSGMILTNTFLADALSLARFDLAEKSKEINMRGAALAKQAAGDSAYVIGTIGPVASFHRMQAGAGADWREIITLAAAACAEQAMALDRAGVDAIILETQIDLESACLAAREVIKVVQVPVGMTFSFHAGEAMDHIPSGQDVREVCEACADLGLAWIGANCGAGIEAMRPVARAFIEATTLPVWIKPNAMAAPSSPADGESDGLDAASFARGAREMIRLGVRFIGGCCGAGPAHVAAMRAMLDAEARE